MCVCITHVIFAQKCSAQRVGRKKKRKAGFISTCQQWVFNDVRPLVLGYFLCLCIFHLDSVREIKKYCRGNQKASYSQTTNSPAFVCGNAKREEERNESEMGA